MNFEGLTAEELTAEERLIAEQTSLDQQAHEVEKKGRRAGPVRAD